MSKITFHPNPLIPKKGVKSKEYEEPVFMQEVIDDLEIKDGHYIVTINGIENKMVAPCQRIEVGDVVTIRCTLEGTGDGNGNTQKVLGGLQIIAGVILIATQAGAGLGASLIIGGASSLVLSIITRQEQTQSQQAQTLNRRTTAASAQFSLQAATNQARRMQPLPVCLSGRGHRFSPDYSSSPYTGNQFRKTQIISGEFTWQPENLSNDPAAENFVYNRVYRSTADAIADGQNNYTNLPYDFGNVPVTGYAFNVSATYDPNLYDWPDFFYKRSSRVFNADGTVDTANLTPSNFASAWQNNFSDVFNGTPPDATDDFRRVPSPHLVWFTDLTDPNLNRWTTLKEFQDHVSFGVPLVTYAAGDHVLFRIDYLTDFFFIGDDGNFAANTFAKDIEMDFYEQKIYHLFNFGFGDCDITDHRIINTDLPSNVDINTSLLNTVIHEPTKTPNDWQILPRPVQLLPSNFGENWEGIVNTGRCPFEDVVTVDGGKLVNQVGDEQNTAFSGPTNITGNNENRNFNFINREGPENVGFIEVDFESQLFRTDPSVGITVHRVDVELFYKPVGGNVWTPFPGFPRTLEWADTNPYRFTVSSGFIGFNQWEIKARKISREQISANNKADINITAVRFFRDESQANFVGENRRSVSIVANGQINGALDRYTALIRNKSWVYRPVTDDYIWDYSSNPADLYLYFMRGGFYNDAADGSFLHPFSPTIGWVNSADHPQNKNRMFGGGLPDDRIDFDSLKEWWVFCDARDLTYDNVLNGDFTCNEILETIAATGRASPSWSTGKLGVIIESPATPITASYGMHNIKRGTFSIDYNNDNIADEIVMQYIDRDSEWQTREVRALMPGVTNSVNPVNISMIGVTDRNIAQREVNLQASRQYYQRRTISFETDIEGFCQSRGDVILVQHDLTQWDYSARVQSVIVSTVSVVSFTVDCELDCADISFAMVKLPCGDTVNLGVTVDGNTVTVISGNWPVADAPCVIDANNNINELAVNNFIPEDFMVLLGGNANPGKKCRIVRILPVDNNSIQLICTDEEPAMYAREFDLTVFPAPVEVTRPCARIYNACVTQLGGGRVEVSWESDGTTGVEIFATVGTLAEYQVFSESGASFFGNNTNIQFASGDSVSLRFAPYTVGTPYAVETTNLTFLVD